MTDFTKFTTEDFLAEETFVNYLSGKNIDDVRFWQNWIKENNQCYTEVEKARLLFFALRDQQYAAHVEQAGSREINAQFEILRSLLSHNIIEEPGYNKEVASTPQMGTRRSGFKKMWVYVSGVAAIFLIAFSLWTILGPTQNNIAKNDYVLFAKTENNTKQISLPDGSKVQLNNNSSVEIPKDYNVDKREILLTGSAFFEVHKDQAKPFIVTSGLTKTTALGTAFYIYGLNHNSTTISLLQGRVSVEERGNKTELTPGEKALYNSGTGIVKSTFNTKQFELWRNGEIEFEQANWNEIKTFIEEYFNKEVIVHGTVPKINFTGNFDAEKIETLLDVLNFTYNAEHTLTGHKVIIAFKTN